MADLPAHFYAQSRRPKPRAVRRIGQHNDPDEAFNLSRRIYPLDSDVSLASVSPASGKLLAAEEGHIGASSGDGEMMLDSPVGDDLHLGQAHPPLPRRQYELPLSRDQDQPAHGPLPDRIYSGDAQFGHEGIPFHLSSINPGWYDPLARGPEVRYGPYHPQFILPPPFASRQYAGYANDPTIHLQSGAMERGHYANMPLPFHGPHTAEYVSPNGGREPSAYQHA